jgi:hypothetical protein
MISRRVLITIARARIADAKALLAAKRYDGAVYLCGYAVELALKARICKTLNWAEFPSSRKEFEGLQSFRVHDLDVLLKLSGLETKTKRSYMTDWSIVAQWNPDARYKPIGTATDKNTQDMITSSSTLLKVLCGR